MNSKKPILNVYINEAGGMYLKEILEGIEEEGVLYQVEKREEYQAKTLASAAANESLLETGIGIDGNNVCVTISKLTEHTPLQIFSLSNNPELRVIGSNAARLIKGIPLKF